MGRKIIVTGASSDIGLMICQKVIKSDDEAMLHCFCNQHKLLPFVQACTGHCRIIPVDFSDRIAVDEFCAGLSEADIVVNAAAATIIGLLANLRDEDIEHMLHVNVLAMVKICRKVIPGMVARRQGCIVNISSVAAQRGNKGQTVYAGTKGFIEAFTRSMAAEYGPRGIRVNCVAPGPIEAGSLYELLGYAADEVKRSIAAKRLGNPGDVAAAVEFLCSEAAGFINGKCLPVDGGFLQGV